MNIAIQAAWSIIRVEDNYFIPSIHLLYLNHITTLYDKVYLIANQAKQKEVPKNYSFVECSNLFHVPISSFQSYFQAQKHAIEYYRAIKSIINKVDLIYSRVPDPFSWMPALLFNKPTIMHFVGDTIDATKHNEKWNWIKKGIMIGGYLPDYLLTLFASRKSKVYTNGLHLAAKLNRYKINAEGVISSSVKEKDLIDKFHNLDSKKVKLIYIGYLRYAKGINTIKDLIVELKDKGFDFEFQIVGSGEMYDDLRNHIISNNLTDKVFMYGHVDDREKIKKLLRSSNLFFFPSLSEGSPRVVIEAISQGVPVISTPVGSVPKVFDEKKDIRFFDYNDYLGAVKIIQEFVDNAEKFDLQRKNAFFKVKANYTIEKFLNKVFS